MYLKGYRVGGGTIYIIKCVRIFISTVMIFFAKITMIRSSVDMYGCFTSISFSKKVCPLSAIVVY